MQTDMYIRALYYAFGVLDAEPDFWRPGTSVDFANAYVAYVEKNDSVTMLNAYAMWLKGKL